MEQLFNIPDPLCSVPRNRIKVKISEPVECLISVLALQNPDVFPRGRQWRQTTLPDMSPSLQQVLNSYFPEGYFAFSMGIFAAFLKAPDTSTIEDFVHVLRQKAEKSPPEALPLSWHVPKEFSSLAWLGERFKIDQRIGPPEHLVERYVAFLSNQQAVLSDVLAFLEEYAGLFRKHAHVWHPTLQSEAEAIRKELSLVEKIDLLAYCSQSGLLGIDDKVAEKLRTLGNVEYVILPSYFAYPHVANLDSPEQAFLIRPAQLTAQYAAIQTAASRYYTNQELALLFKALSDETRLAMLQQLVNRRMYGLEIAASLGLSQPTASHHLSSLVQANLLHIEKEGTYTYYSANREKIRQIVNDLAFRL